jgi:hypothetical protein
MQLTVATWDDRVVVVEIDANDPVETLKAILEVETGVPIAEQQLSFQGRSLQSGTTLASAGVGNGDLVMLGRAQAGGELPCCQPLQRFIRCSTMYSNRYALVMSLITSIDHHPNDMSYIVSFAWEYGVAPCHAPQACRRFTRCLRDSLSCVVSLQDLARPSSASSVSSLHKLITQPCSWLQMAQLWHQLPSSRRSRCSQRCCRSVISLRVM